jgi:hypothetical protein
VSISIKAGGVYKALTEAFVYSGASPVAVQSIHVKVAGVWEEVWSAEVLVIVSASTTLLVLEDMFDSGGWAAEKAKRVYLAAGVIVGSGTTATAAIRSGAEWGGTLTLDGHATAEVQGAGGLGSTSTSNAGGVGGDAIDVNHGGSKVLKVIGAFAIKAGGGGGGKGGAGEATVTEGPTYDINYYNWAMVPDAGSQFNVTWGSLLHVGYTGASSYAHGDGWTYARGAYVETLYSNGWYQISRSQLQARVGGDGGRGRGYDGDLTTGATGGTNAGDGGDGGDWGTAGDSGTNGNDTPNGSAGGAAGWLIKNPSLADKTAHMGTQAGRTS